MNKLRQHLLVIMATFMVAGSFIASANLAGIINPISLTLMRFVCAVLLLMPIIMSKKDYRTKILSTLPRSLVISFFYSAYFLCMFEALKTTSALNTGTIYTLVPLVTTVLAIAIFKIKISKAQILAYLIAGIGTVWVVFKADWQLLLSFSLNHGDMIFALGALSMCFYSLSMKMLYRQDIMIVLVFCTLLGGSLWMGLALLLSGQALDWNLLQGDDLFSMAYLVIVATIATAYLYQKTTVALGPTCVMSYIYLNPAAVALLAFLIKGETMAAIVLPGVFLSLAATISLQKSSHQ